MSNSELLRIKNKQKMPYKKTKDCKQLYKKNMTRPNDRFGFNPNLMTDLELNAIVLEKADIGRTDLLFMMFALFKDNCFFYFLSFFLFFFLLFSSSFFSFPF